MQIGLKTIDACVFVISELLRSHQTELNDAYLRADNSLKISLALKISPDADGHIVEGSISFVAEKIKDTLEKKVYEKQLELEFERPIEQGA